MTESDRAAIDVYSVAIQPKLLFYREVLRGECLVYLHQIDVFERQTGFFQCQSCCRYRTRSHDSRIDTGNSPRNDPAEWSGATFLGIF